MYLDRNYQLMLTEKSSNAILAVNGYDC